MDPERGEPGSQEGRRVDISRHYDGLRHFYKGHTYRNPTPEVVGRQFPIPESETVTHRDFLGRITEQPKDLARYISSTYAKPFHIIVQATPKAFKEPQGEWRRTSLKGYSNTLLRLSVWAVGDLGDPLPKGSTELTLMWLKVLLVLPAEMILLPFPFKRGRISEMYPTFFSRSWDYPKYARNILDANPEFARKALSTDPNERPTVRWSGRRGGAANHLDPSEETNGSVLEGAHGIPDVSSRGALYEISGDTQRVLIPRKLMIKQEDGHWKLSDGTCLPYVVLSYVGSHFSVDEKTTSNPQIEQMAEDMAARSGVRAYWVDFRCRAQKQPELTDDVHRICDVFRGARQVYVVLPNLSLECKRVWGSRMWCLPEARKSQVSSTS
jgi:hypothetical protein